MASGPDEAADDIDALGIEAGDIRDANEDGDAEPELFEVWPENQPAVDLFLDVATQWRAVAAPEGAAGMVSAIWSRIVCTGLDYTAVQATLAMRRVPRREQSELLSDLQVMEYAALDEMRIQRMNETR